MIKNITLLVFLAGIVSYSLQAQTTDINGGPWEAWIGPGNTPNITGNSLDPNDWRSDLTTTAGWGVPNVGTPNQGQATGNNPGLNNVFNVNDNIWVAPFTPITHYVWGIPNQQTTFYRLIFSVDDGDDCIAYRLLTAADNEHKVWLNGVKLDTLDTHNGFLNLEIPKRLLVCGQNMISVEAVERTGLWTPHYFIGQLNQTPDTDCCLDSIDILRHDCENFSFTLRDNQVNKNSIIWTLDGEIIEDSTDLETIQLTLTPGHHTICAKYFGTTYPCGTDICCGESCVDIDIPEPEWIEELQTICDFNNGDPSTLLYDPCLVYFDFDFFLADIEIDDGSGNPILTQHDSRDSGCQVVLGPGYHVFKFFDEDGCLIRTLGITVVIQQALETECEQTVTVDCGSSLDLTQYESCPACNVDPEFPWGQWKKVVTGPDEVVANTLLSNITQSATYRRIHEDPLNCKKCIITVHVNVVREYVEMDIILTQPDCDWSIDFNSLNTLLQNNNPVWCNGAYTEFQIVQTDMNLVPTGQTFNLLSGFGIVLPSGFVYTVRPTDPASCCEVRIRVICDEGMVPPPPMNWQEQPYIDVFEGAVFTNSNSLQRSNVAAGTREQAASLKIIPNPTNNQFVLETIGRTTQSFDEIAITDLTGHTVRTYGNVDSNQTFDLSGLAPGVYSVAVRRGELLDHLILTLVKQ